MRKRAYNQANQDNKVCHDDTGNLRVMASCSGRKNEERNDAEQSSNKGNGLQRRFEGREQQKAANKALASDSLLKANAIVLGAVAPIRTGVLRFAQKIRPNMHHCRRA
ncbi:hypothetical protein [Massilia sp. TSP1-1-2]|uniref:hypothetical protein n=1 Tax=Massilia sp. TSP1-1-2 TaxID=2804649 RepID=UPI003CE9400F